MRKKYIGDEPVEVSRLTICGRLYDQLRVQGKTYWWFNESYYSERYYSGRNLMKMISRIVLKFYLEQTQFISRGSRNQVKEQNTNQ